MPVPHHTHSGGDSGPRLGNEALKNPNHYMVVQAHIYGFGSNQTDVEIFEFTAPLAMTLAEVQVYTRIYDAEASVDVKEAGTTVLSAPVTPSAGAVVKGTISDDAIASGAAVTVHGTTDALGNMTDLTVTLIFKFELVP